MLSHGVCTRERGGGRHTLYIYIYGIYIIIYRYIRRHTGSQGVCARERGAVVRRHTESIERGARTQGGEDSGSGVHTTWRNTEEFYMCGRRSDVDSLPALSQLGASYIATRSEAPPPSPSSHTYTYTNFCTHTHTPHTHMHAHTWPHGNLFPFPSSFGWHRWLPRGLPNRMGWLPGVAFCGALTRRNLPAGVPHIGTGAQVCNCTNFCYTYDGLKAEVRL